MSDLTRRIRGAKVLAIAVAILCAVAFMPLLGDSAQSQAATKLKVSKTKVTVTVGKSVKVTANKKKATWSSAKTTVANLTKTKGTTVYIQGIKKGTTKVTVKYGKQKKVITVTVKAAPKPAAAPKNTTVNPDGYVKEGDVSVTGYYQGDATVYSLLYQESAEVAAQQIQAFKLAKIKADEAIDKNGGKGEGLAIVTDIDSTIADDTCYVAGAVLDAAGRIALEMDPWNNDDWNGYYEAVATEADTPIPGAKEFLDYTYSKGIEWYYITNRPYYELDLTVQQLYHQGFLEKAPDKDKNGKPDLVDAFSVLTEDPDGEGPFQTYQDYYYYGDEALGTTDADGWMNVYDNATYTNALNATGKVEMTPQSFSVANDYRVQVQGTDFDSDKGWRRANVAKVVGGYDKIIMYLGDSINDMVSDYETKYPEIWGGTDRWDGQGADFTRKKQFNDTRTANATKDYWAAHWGEDFIVLPNATYGDWYKTTWAKGKDPDNKHDSSTVKGQQEYIYDQIWSHSYKNKDKFPRWYDGPSKSDEFTQ